VRRVKLLYPELRPEEINTLREITLAFRISVACGEIVHINGHWYVTHAGLLRIASRRKCVGIVTRLQRTLSDVAARRWVFKATVYVSSNSRGFVDADPLNTSSAVHGAEMRVAETRAVNRALRKAYGIGICSVEELGAFYSTPATANVAEQPVKSPSSNGSSNGQLRLKDRLCLLIREFSLDSTLVKAYAADFCGSETLRGASRELVESFIAHLEKEAREDREKLACKLNSYSHPAEVHS
jgi:hypothetical protein